MVSTKDIRAFLTEFLGSFFIVFVTCWSYTAKRDGKIDYLALGIANAFVISGCVWAGVTNSGAHFNPVITTVKLFIRSINVAKATFYILSQLIGSLLATLLVLLLVPVDINENLETSFDFPKKRKTTSEFQASIMEFVLSMLYVFVYFATIVDKRAPTNIFGFALGGVILMGTVSAGAYTGACANPLRIFGPYLLTAQLGESMFYWLATMAGGIFAGFYYDFFMLDTEDIDAEEESESLDSKGKSGNDKNSSKQVTSVNY